MEKLTLTQVRKMKGLTQEEFGKVVGISRQEVSNKENGRADWKLHHVREICEKLEIDPTILNLKP